MQPIKDGYSPVISPTEAAKSRTYHCLLSEPVRCHIKDIQLNHPASYNTKSSQIRSILAKNGKKSSCAASRSILFPGKETERYKKYSSWASHPFLRKMRCIQEDSGKKRLQFGTWISSLYLVPKIKQRYGKSRQQRYGTRHGRTGSISRVPRYEHHSGETPQIQTDQRKHPCLHGVRSFQYDGGGDP